MSRVFLTTANPSAIAGDWWTDYSRLKRSALAGSGGKHFLVESPELADIILFSDPASNTQADIRRHELWKLYEKKTFVFSCQDRIVPIVPGVYAGAEKRWFLPEHMRSGYYIKVVEHEWIQPSSFAVEPRYLYSFCGAFDTHPIRQRLGGLSSSDGLIRDTSKDEARGVGQSARSYSEWAAHYARTLADSKFVLCPRGVAPASYRLFEAMKAARVPVVISDDWVPPGGPEWDEFCIRIPEAQLECVPEFLRRREHQAAIMGERAREAWNHWFSPERAFQTIAEWCDQIGRARSGMNSFGRYRPFFQLARPHFLRHAVLATAKLRSLELARKLARK